MHQDTRIPHILHMQAHKPREPGHNTPLEEVCNIQPEEKHKRLVLAHKRLVVAHRLVLVDTVAAPGNSPGDKQVELRLH